ncbi:MAG TPA: hypothetical protein VKN36_16090 [Eudoraea sp.]|nr:hypothetical protein [Eudoraea sp.]
MSYKLKSLLYFACFLVAVVTYYSLDHELPLEEMANTADLAEADIVKTSSEGIIDLEELK